MIARFMFFYKPGVTVAYPAGFRLPEFVKFSGKDIMSTFEHISQYLAQLGEDG